MTETAADTRDYERLNRVLAARRDDTQAWLRAGTLFRLRRQVMNPAWANARTFARDRDINYKLVGDLETAARTNFTLDLLVRRVAPAYGVTYTSIADALNGGHLVPLDDPGRPAGRPEVARTAAAVPPPAAAAAVLPAGMITAARPYVDDINRSLRRWTVDWARAHPDVDAREIPAPPGEALFPPGSRPAASWNLHRDELDIDELVWLIAALQAHAATAARERGADVGLGGRRFSGMSDTAGLRNQYATMCLCNETAIASRAPRCVGKETQRKEGPGVA